MKCPNCGDVHGAEDQCFLAMLLGALANRLDDGLSDEQVAQIMRDVDVDSLWESFGGPAVDYLQDEVLARTPA